ncbi:MAG: hypothetical protein ACJ72H_23945 [Candidatus Sulfotelmatobacter sp.]
MRMMVKIEIPTSEGSRAIQDGTMQRLIESRMAALKPEAAYFFLEDGVRTMVAVFDMQSTSDMVALFEPAMMQLNAKVKLFPVMTSDDLQTGFGKLK